MFKYESCEAVADRIRKLIKTAPEIAIICGSGLGKLADFVEDVYALDYSDIEEFPKGSVVGHNSKIVFGTLSGKSVAVLQGRAHLYEGFSMQQLVFPIRVLRALGAKYLVVTNASGSLNPTIEVGDFVVLKDQISLLGMCGVNPFVGSHDPRFGPRFFPMSQAYPKELRRIVLEAGEKLGLSDCIHEGTYFQTSGPAFETPAEARLMIIAGADIVGMSTAHEVMTAVHAGLKVIGIALVTNKVIVDPNSEETVNHSTVVEMSRKRVDHLAELVKYTVSHLE